MGEVVKTTICLQHFCSRPEIQVIGIGQDYLIPHIFYCIVVNTFYCSVCAHRHKRRSQNISMRQVYDSKSSLRVFVSFYFFENSGNVYKLLFASTDVENAVAKSEEMCKAMSFKPFTYYNDITAMETTETTTSEK